MNQTTEERILAGLQHIAKQLASIQEQLGDTKTSKKGNTKFDADKAMVWGMGRYRDKSYPILDIPEAGGILLAWHNGESMFYAKKADVDISRWQEKVPWRKAADAQFSEIKLFDIDTRE